jgi:hypothetical protein
MNATTLEVVLHFIHLRSKARTPVGVRKYFVPAAIGDDMELRSISSPIAAGSSSCLTLPLLYAQFGAPDDGRKGRPKHVERFTRINNLR